MWCVRREPSRFGILGPTNSAARADCRVLCLKGSHCPSAQDPNLGNNPPSLYKTLTCAGSSWHKAQHTSVGFGIEPYLWTAAPPVPL